MQRISKVSWLAAAALLCGCAGYAGSESSPSFAPSNARTASSIHRATSPAYYGLTLLVTNENAAHSPSLPPNAVLGFTIPSSGGNISPSQNITGSNTQLTNCLRLTAGPAGSIFATNGSEYIYKFPKGSNGNVGPSLTLDVGSTYVGGMVVDSSGDLWVATYGFSGVDFVGTINEYADGAHGKATPIKTISGSKTGLAQPLGLAFAPNGNLYVGNNTNGLPNVEIFSSSASGNVAPIATVGGSNTGFGNIWQIYVDNSSYSQGRLLVADDVSNKILVFAPGATGNASPVQAITNMQSPEGVATDSSGNIYAAGGANDNTVREYKPGATGNATPLIVITGSNTKLGGASQIFMTTQ